ncbi:MAG: PAS domain S-box protein [Bacillota bacterium]
MLLVSEVDYQGANGRFIEINEVVCEKLGYSRTELLRMYPHDITPYDPLSRDSAVLLDKYLAIGEVTFETVLISKFGCVIPVEINAHTIEYDSREAVLFIARDITERKLNERKLVYSEERYRQLVELLPDAVIVHDLSGKILFANNASVKILKATGKKQLLSRLAMDFLHPAFREAVQERLKAVKRLGTVPFEQEIIINSAGEEVIVEISGILIDYYNQPAVMLVCRDISQRKQAEQALEETQRVLFEKEKLALIGQMSAGMVHEVRNPLAVVRGYAQLLKIRQYEKEKIDNFVDSIISEIDRVNVLISDFLQLARPKETRLKRESIVKIIKELLEIITPQAMLNNIQIKHTIVGNNYHCLIDKDQIKQVILNLCRNSIDAMTSGGVISINIKEISEAEEISIEIEDNGCGIPPDKLSKLGTPFYTTKEKGTGLGLSISYSIIRAHGGRIEVESTVEKGTKFIIFLKQNNKSGW